VSVPLKVTGKVGVPVSIGCQVTCAGTTSALISIAGLVGPIRIPAVTNTAHAPGAFTVTIALSASVRAKITAAIKAKKKVTTATTTMVVAGLHSVSVVKVSTFHLLTDHGLVSVTGSQGKASRTSGRWERVHGHHA
jgi:hypothetical protein